MPSDAAWRPGLLAVSPAFAAAVAAGAIGLATPIGAGLAVLAAAWVGVDLAILGPRRGRARSPDELARDFLNRALATDRIEDVAAELGRTLTAAYGAKVGHVGHGASRAVMMVPAGDGGDGGSAVRILPVLGTPPTLTAVDEAFLWLGDVHAPLDRDSLIAVAGADDPVAAGGARAVLGLIDQCGGDVVLPLLHRGLLLGVVVLTAPPAVAIGDLARFCRALRAYATAAVARTFLDAEARGRTQLARSFDLATAMQEAMMPDERPVRRPGFELRGLFRPVAECGGDLWMWRELDGQVLLLIADATGHGAAPALLAAVVKGSIDAHCQLIAASEGQLDPAALLAELNGVVYRAAHRQYLMTAFAAVIDVRTRSVRYANAGQNFPYVVLPASGDVAASVEVLVLRGDSLGSAPEARYDTRSRILGRGDKLFFYTDGVIDAGTPHRDAFGDKRLRAILVGNAHERATRLPELVVAEVDGHAGGSGALSDDVTLLAFELLDDAGGHSGAHS